GKSRQTPHGPPTGVICPHRNPPATPRVPPCAAGPSSPRQLPSRPRRRRDRAGAVIALTTPARPEAPPRTTGQTGPAPRGGPTTPPAAPQPTAAPAPPPRSTSPRRGAP